MHRLLIIKEEFEKNVCLQKMKMEAKARIGACGASGPETPPPGVDMGAVCSGGRAERLLNFPYPLPHVGS